MSDKIREALGSVFQDLRPMDTAHYTARVVERLLAVLVLKGVLTEEEFEHFTEGGPLPDSIVELLVARVDFESPNPSREGVDDDQ